MSVKFDLLGHPIPERHGKSGRNGHVPTPEIASKIRVLLVANMPLERIATEVDLSIPTLRKHYFQNGKVNRRHAREMALAEAKARNLLQLQAEGDKGNVSALKEVRKIVEREMFLAMDDEVTGGKGKKKAAAATLPGKKEAARAAALEAEDEIEHLFHSEGQVH